MLHLFAPLLLSHAEDAGALPQQGWEHPAIKRTKEYLEAHYTEEVALQELAGVVNMSPFHLSRVFRQTVGLPPHAYQTKLRLVRAKTLLAQGGKFMANLFVLPMFCKCAIVVPRDLKGDVTNRLLAGLDCENVAMSEDMYTRLTTLLDEQNVPYRLIDHEPEGRTEIVSALRGNRLEQAAKCIILMVKVGKKVTRYVLAVVPGDARVDMQVVKALLQGTYIAFASTDIAERLAGSVTGTVLPFSFHPDLELIVHPALLENNKIYFNAARLDRSMVLKTSDYVMVAKPRVAVI